MQIMTIKRIFQIPCKRYCVHNAYLCSAFFQAPVVSNEHATYFIKLIMKHLTFGTNKNIVSFWDKKYHSGKINTKMYFIKNLLHFEIYNTKLG